MKSLVRDVMTTEVVTIQPWTLFREIVTRLAEHRISAAPVLDAEGNVLGIVTEAGPGAARTARRAPRGSHLAGHGDRGRLPEDRRVAPASQRPGPDRVRPSLLWRGPLDPDLYHLVLDSPALGLDTCVDLVIAASEARMRQAHPAGHG